MGDNQFNDCSLCRYRKKGDSQVCARYMTNNGAPCNGDGLVVKMMTLVH